jgi:hypothetical protein
VHGAAVGRGTVVPFHHVAISSGSSFSEIEFEAKVVAEADNHYI